MKIPRFVLGATLVLSFGLPVLAAGISPAQNLFDQASFYLTFHYHGYSKKDLKLVEQKYQSKLDAICKGKENCGFDDARKVVGQMFEEMEDDHTYYLEPQGANDLSSALQGESNAAQIDDGLEFARIPGGTDFRVVEVREGSPALEAGVERGDRIVAFNGKAPPVGRQEFLEFYRPLLQDGKTYKLNVVKHESENKELSVVPRSLELDDLPFLQMLANGVARIVVPSFDAYAKVGPKIHALVKRATLKEAKAIVVDLRDDPGGSITECMSGAGAFVNKIVRIRETRFGRSIEGFKDGRVFRGEGANEDTVYELREPVRWQGPLAVMVNANSASCSEVFAADVQIAKVGTVVGEPTAGVGNTGAQGFELIDGGAALVTTVRTLQVNGAPYPERISPNVAVKDDMDLFLRRGRDLILEKSLESLGMATTLLSNATISGASISDVGTSDVLANVLPEKTAQFGIPLLHYGLTTDAKQNWRLWK